VQILGGGQVVLQSGHEDGGEVEDVRFLPKPIGKSSDVADL